MVNCNDRKSLIPELFHSFLVKRLLQLVAISQNAAERPGMRHARLGRVRDLGQSPGTVTQSTVGEPATDQNGHKVAWGA